MEKENETAERREGQREKTSSREVGRKEEVKVQNNDEAKKIKSKK